MQKQKQVSASNVKQVKSPLTGDEKAVFNEFLFSDQYPIVRKIIERALLGETQKLIDMDPENCTPDELYSATLKNKGAKNFAVALIQYFESEKKIFNKKEAEGDA